MDNEGQLGSEAILRRHIDLRYLFHPLGAIREISEDRRMQEIEKTNVETMLPFQGGVDYAH